MKATKQAVFNALSDERVFQDRKWGAPDKHPHEVGGYLTIMRKLLGDAETAWSTKRGDAGALDELRKVCAVGVACMEQHGIVARAVIDFAEQSPHFTVSKADPRPEPVIAQRGGKS